MQGLLFKVKKWLLKERSVLKSLDCTNLLFKSIAREKQLLDQRADHSLQLSSC